MAPAAFSPAAVAAAAGAFVGLGVGVAFGAEGVTDLSVGFIVTAGRDVTTALVGSAVTEPLL